MKKTNYITKLNQRGITLIALIITIIVLLILAGIIISLTIGERGVINHAQQAGIKSEEATAREKLDLALIDLQADKATNPEYNENEYIDSYLSREQMVVMGDIVLVDGWQFQIDRSVPKIAIALGKGQESQEITLTATVENKPDFTKSKIKIEVVYEGEIASIQINGTEIEIPEKVDGKYILEQEILQNGNYTVYVKDANDSYKIANVKVTEISEDIAIRTAQDLAAFRDRVNKGATYAGKTVTLENDIDLSSVCGADVNGVEVSWVPIGNDTSTFLGTFDGNNNKISNLYINDSQVYLGFFNQISNTAIVQNLVLENIYVCNKVESNTGGVVGSCVTNGKVLNCGIDSGSIIYNGAGSGYAGGIAGRCKSGNVENCYNKASITTNTLSTADYVRAGGIVGELWYGSSVINCYNLGTVKCNNAGTRVQVGGIVGAMYKTSTLKNGYNIGAVSGSARDVKFIAGVVGECGESANYPGGSISNSYCTTSTYSYYYWNGSKVATSTAGKVAADTLKGYASNLGSAFTNDVQNLDGTWKYNDGYPILKWQVEQ